MKQYDAWIAEYLARHNGQVLGKCRDAVQEMLVAFPELKEVRGHVYCAWGMRGHVWLETSEGDLVDPTRAQFPLIYEYEPWKPGGHVRVGKCMNCGEEIWKAIQSLEENPGQESICSPACHEAYATYCMGGLEEI